MLTVIVAQISSQKLIGDRVDTNNSQGARETLICGLPVECFPGSNSTSQASPEPIKVSGDVECRFLLVESLCFNS